MGVSSKRHQDEQAVKLFESVREIFAENHAMDGAAECDINIACVRGNLGQYEEALELFKSAKEILEDKKLDSSLGICSMHMARTYLLLNRHEEAIELCKSAMKIFDKEEMKSWFARSEMIMADIYGSLGQYKKTLEFCESAADVFKMEGSIISEARCLMKMASIYGSFGQHKDSLELYKSARETFEKAGMRFQAAECDRRIGDECLRLGLYEEAIELYGSAMTIYEEMGQREKAIFCEMDIAGAYRKRGQFEDALKIYESARETLEAIGVDIGVVACDIGRAVIFSQLGEFQNAFLLMEGIHQANAHLFRLKWRNLVGMGWNLMALGKLDQAREYYCDAIEEIESIRTGIEQEELRHSFLKSVSEVYSDMVKICLDLGDCDGALEYVERMKCRNLAELLEKIDLMPRNITEEEREEYRKLCFRMRSCEYRLRGADRQARIFLRALKYKPIKREYESMLEELRKKDPDFDPEQRIQITGPEIRDLANDCKAALVELFPMRENTIAFVVIGDRRLEDGTICIPDCNLLGLRKHMEELRGKYVAFRQCHGTQEERGKREAWEKHLDSILRQLYDTLFLRIKPHLGDIERMIIIPHAEFQLLPLHAMYTEEDGIRRYVIDDFLVAYSPSAKVLRQCRERNRSRKGQVIIAHANPEKTERLPFSPYEADAIAAMYDNSKVIRGATRSDIIEHGLKAHIFHYTGHANFKSLILHHGDDGKKEDKYTVEDIFTSLYLPAAHLATLSSCETGMIRPAEMDEYIGLTSGFLHAGATTVISSLWSVPEISTSLLMNKMYELIKEGKRSAEALREAQLWLKNPANRQEQKELLKKWCDKEPSGYDLIDPDLVFNAGLERPFHWAGFTCSGAG